MIALQNILIATDFGEPAGAALAYGRKLARTFGGTLQVLHVFEGVSTRGIGVAYFGNPPDVQRHFEESARKRIEAFLTEEDRRDLGARAVVLDSNETALAIVNYARSARIDLIVIGTHGRSGVSHVLMGSVAEKVVRMAPCPVLTVHHPEHEFIVPNALPVEKAS